MKKSIKILSIAFLSIGLLFASCSKDDLHPTISVSDYTGSVAENPTMDQLIGIVSATIENGNYTRFAFVPEHTGIGGHVSMNSSGELRVTNPGFFDYEQNTTISGTAEVITFDDKDNETRASFTVTINITDVIETPPTPDSTVQQRLDGTETPLDIYNSDPTLLDSLYGKNYAGGLIFQLDISTGSGMVAYASTYTPLPWDFNTTGLVATNATSTNVGDGLANTNTILSALGSGGVYPASVCDALFNGGSGDWYLPTLDELNLVYKVLHANGYGDFQNVKYWTSSELDAGHAWVRDFSVSSGQISTTVSKTYSHYFRPIRSF